MNAADHLKVVALILLVSFFMAGLEKLVLGVSFWAIFIAVFVTLCLCHFVREWIRK